MSTPGEHHVRGTDVEGARQAWRFSGRRGTPVDLTSAAPASLPPRLQKDVSRIAAERRKRSTQQSPAAGSSTAMGTAARQQPPVSASPPPIERRAPRATQPVVSSAPTVPGPDTTQIAALTTTDLVPPDITEPTSSQPSATTGATTMQPTDDFTTEPNDETPGASTGSSRSPRRELSASEKKRLAKAKMKRRKELEKRRAKEAKKQGKGKPEPVAAPAPVADSPQYPAPTPEHAAPLAVPSFEPAAVAPDVPAPTEFGGADAKPDAPTTDKATTPLLKRLFGSKASTPTETTETSTPAPLPTPDTSSVFDAPAPSLAPSHVQTPTYDTTPNPASDMTLHFPDVAAIDSLTHVAPASEHMPEPYTPLDEPQATYADEMALPEPPVFELEQVEYHGDGVAEPEFNLLDAIEPSPIETAHAAVDMIGDPALLIPIITEADEEPVTVTESWLVDDEAPATPTEAPAPVATFTAPAAPATPEPVAYEPPAAAAPTPPAPKPVAEPAPVVPAEPETAGPLFVNETQPATVSTHDQTRERMRRSRPTAPRQGDADLRMQEREIRARIEAKRRELDVLFAVGPTTTD